MHTIIKFKCSFLFAMLSIVIFVFAHSLLKQKALLCTLNVYTEMKQFGKIVPRSQGCFSPPVYYQGTGIHVYLLFLKLQHQSSMMELFYNLDNSIAAQASGSNDAISSGSLDQELFCYCHGSEEGTMVGCDNEDCKTKWFHTRCLKIKTVPKGK